MPCFAVPGGCQRRESPGHSRGIPQAFRRPGQRRRPPDALRHDLRGRRASSSAAAGPLGWTGSTPTVTTSSARSGRTCAPDPANPSRLGRIRALARLRRVYSEGEKFPGTTRSSDEHPKVIHGQLGGTAFLHVAHTRSTNRSSSASPRATARLRSLRRRQRQRSDGTSVTASSSTRRTSCPGGSRPDDPDARLGPALERSGRRGHQQRRRRSTRIGRRFPAQRPALRHLFRWDVRLGQAVHCGPASST